MKNEKPHPPTARPNTRGHIVAVARTLFAKDGYHATSTDRILAETGLSRGALYHHFENKEAIFAAVLEAVESDLAARATQAFAAASDPVQAMRASLVGFLRQANEPEIRVIILTDAASVVGWRKWREIEELYGLGLIKSALERMAGSGRIASNMIEVYAHIILASMIEIAFVIANAKDYEAEFNRGALAINQLLDRLLQPNE